MDGNAGSDPTTTSASFPAPSIAAAPAGRRRTLSLNSLWNSGQFHDLWNTFWSGSSVGFMLRTHEAPDAGTRFDSRRLRGAGHHLRACREGRVEDLFRSAATGRPASGAGIGADLFGAAVFRHFQRQLECSVRTTVTPGH